MAVSEPDRTAVAATTGRRIVLGVGGGIAAYKAVALLRLLTEAGHDVTVVPTAAALRFVGTATWVALSHKRAHSEVWNGAVDVAHVALGRSADLVVVAPATADLIGRAANGLADDLLTATLLTARCPVLMAPAMHTEMWEHPAVVDNVARLRARAVCVVEPASGRLTGSDTGTGRLPEPAQIAELAELLLHRGIERDLVGAKMLVTAGGTREPLDPVRYLGNRSSGRQGYAVAAVAALRGAHVTLIAANTELPDPSGVDVQRVSTALELRTATHAAAAQADVVVMAAAVADFRPAAPTASKIKKNGSPAAVELVANPDILAELVVARGPAATPILVGFAAETGDGDGDVLEHGRQKLARKGCDLLAVNEVGARHGFGRPDNEVTLLSRTGAAVEIPRAAKAVVAAAILDAVVALRLSGVDR